MTPLRLRGFWRICRILCRLMRINKRQWVLLPNDLKFSIDLKDPYWDRLISPHHHYEPELDWLLSTLKDVDYSFVDCGANLGYWSCNAAADHYGSKPVYAVEPLNENFSLLRNHLHVNGLTATCYHRAVSEFPKQRISLFKPGGNASVSIVKPKKKPDSHHEWIETITLDCLLQDLPPSPHKLVLKLDVEDSEVPSLKGATNFLKRYPLIVYEDHGRDLTDRVSDYVMRVLHYRIFYLNDALEILPVRNNKEVRAIKVRKDKGYNFFAFDRKSDWAKYFKPQWKSFETD